MSLDPRRPECFKYGMPEVRETQVIEVAQLGERLSALRPCERAALATRSRSRGSRAARSRVRSE